MPSLPLYRFVTLYQSELIDRCRSKNAKRRDFATGDSHMQHGVPVFITQLAEILALETDTHARQRHDAADSSTAVPAIAASATRHGQELFEDGCTLAQVVHDYGDLCQAVTELAVDRDVPIATSDFHTFNRCLDVAIAGAVTEFSRRRDLVLARLPARAGVDRGDIAQYAIDNAGQATVSPGPGVPRVAPVTARRESLSAFDVLADVTVWANHEAQEHGCGLVVEGLDPAVRVYAEREVLLRALGALLRNAFTYTARGTRVTLKALPHRDRVLISVHDHREGLPADPGATIFRPYVPADARTDLGADLNACRRDIEANDGVLSVRDLPNSCTFTIDLPRLTARVSIPNQATR